MRTVKPQRGPLAENHPFPEKWEEEDITSNQTLWDIEEFEQRTISKETMIRLKASLASMEADTEKLRQETAARFNELKRREKQLKEELEKLQAGSKAYPKYLEEAREYLKRRLFEETGKSADVFVLADLLEVKHPEWANAIEGYLGNNKLSLVVSPRYARAALKIYSELDPKNITVWRFSIQRKLLLFRLRYLKILWQRNRG